MFDLGFSEILVIGLVALIVIGPERLPGVARTVGHLLGRLQRYVADVKGDIQREMQIEELKKLQQQVEQSARELETSVRGQIDGVRSEIHDTAALLADKPAEASPDAMPKPDGSVAPVSPDRPADPVPADKVSR